MGANINEAKFSDIIKNSFLSRKSIVDVPDSLIEYKNIPLCTLGNISTVLGKPKTKKSFLLTYLIAQCLKTTNKDFTIKFPKDKDTILYVDTEQSNSKTIKNIDNIHRLIKDDGDNPRLLTMNIRQYSPSDKIGTITQYLTTNPSISLLVIDGIRDFVTEINNEKDVSSIMTTLLQWCHTYNIHVLLVIHENKGKRDDSARGHLGTEIMNKTENILHVEKITKVSSSVSCMFARDKEFETFSLSITSEGLPLIGTEIKPPKKSDFNKQPPTIHQSVLDELFKNVKEYRNKDLQSYLPAILNKYQLPSSFSNVTKYITYIRENELVEYDKSSGLAIYRYKKV